MALSFWKIGCLALVAALAACGGKPDPLVARCPARAVQMADRNQTFLTRVEMGETSAKPLNGLGGLVRQATLDRPGQAPLKVAFFQTGVLGCPWQVNQPMITPVVIKDGVIVAVGSQMLQGMIDDGWQIREATWPWNDYQFGYIPPR